MRLKNERGVSEVISNFLRNGRLRVNSVDPAFWTYIKNYMIDSKE